MKESAEITRNDKLLVPADNFQKAGELFSEIGQLFKESENATDLEKRISKASNIFMSIAELEEDTYKELLRIVK